MNGSFLRLASALSVLCALVATAGAMTATAQEAAAPGTLDHATRQAVALVERAEHDLGNDPAEAADLATQAVGFAERAGEEAVLARSHATLARARWLLGDDAGALRHYLEAVRRYRLIDDGTGVARALLGLATIYNRQGRYDRARQAAREALALYEEVGDPPGMARAYNSLGHVAREAGAFEEALGLYREELRLAEDVGDEEPVASARHNVGMALHALGRTGEAVAAFEASLAALRRIGYPVGLSKVLYSLGSVELERGRLGPARRHLQESLALADTLGLLDVQVLAHQRLAGVAEAEGRPSEAVRHLQAHATLQDTLARRTLREEVARTAARYEADEREREIALLQAEADVQALRVVRQRGLLTSSGVGLLLLLGVAGALWRGSRIRRRANALLAQKNAEVEAALERTSRLLAERETLMREIHHRVKNNLQVVSSLLSLQGRTLTSPTAQDLVRQLRSRIMAMALIHQKLYQTDGLAAIDVRAYAEDLVGFLFQTYGGAGRVGYELRVDPVRLDVEAAIPLGLILSELVSNAFKYAFPDGRPGTVRVTFHAGDAGDGAAADAYVLRVADDGAGFPPDVDAATATSLGLRLVRDLARQLRGGFAIGSGEAGGTSATVRFHAADLDVRPAPVTAEA